MRRISAWRVISGIVALALGFQTSEVRAEDLQWRGFFTTGVAFSDSSTPYNEGITKKARVAQETFLGLNLSKALNEKWRFAGQIVGRAAQSDSAAKVDWAFVAYEPNNNLNITLGKQKIPLWMMSAYLDVGRAYPWVVPPEEVYTLFNLRSFAGAALSYSLPLGDSVLVVRPYGGDVYLESSPNAPTTTSKFEGSNMLGASLEWTQGTHLLRLAFNRALWNLGNDPNQDYGHRNYILGTIGAKTEIFGWGLLAEYVTTHDEDNKRYQQEAGRLETSAKESAAAGDTAAAAVLSARASLLRIQIGGSHAYYATLSKQLESYLLHVTYASVSRPFLDFLSRDQSSVALGLNYDLDVESVIKVEAKRLTIPEKSQGVFDAVPDDDEAMVYRIGYSMIF